MRLTTTTPVAAIEGIGEAFSRRLESIGVKTVLDLFSVSPRRILDAVADRASAKQVDHWRRSALFLRVEGVDPQVAEAFARGGIKDLNDLAGLPLADLDQILMSAMEAHLIPDRTPVGRLADIRVNAAILEHTGTCSGLVIDENNHPVSGATVRLGKLKQRTDQQGRFYFASVPLRATYPPLFITLDGLTTLLAERPTVTADSWVVRMKRYHLLPQPQVELSELQGDELPSPVGMPMVRVTDSELRDEDILRIRKIDAERNEASLASRFLGFRAGRFIVRRMKVSLEALPQGLREGDHVIVRHGKLLAFSGDRKSIQRARARLRRQKAMAALEGPTPEDQNEAYQRWFELALRNGRIGRTLKGVRNA